MTGLVLTACGTIQADHTGPPPPAPGVSTATVCAPFDQASSPLAHRISDQDALADLAARATDSQIRALGEALVRQRDGHPDGVVVGGKAFSDLGAICVAKGLTPKHWAELA